MKKAALVIALLITVMIIPVSMDAEEKLMTNSEMQPVVVQQFIEEAKKNSNWKTPFATGKHEQIVFMNISPQTNPKNEIGMEVHPFDQAILIVEGKGQLLLNGKTSLVQSGDMIFIPEGTRHNVINLGGEKELKLISFYSDIDMPKDAVYKKKTDEPQE